MKGKDICCERKVTMNNVENREVEKRKNKAVAAETREGEGKEEAARRHRDNWKDEGRERRIQVDDYGRKVWNSFESSTLTKLSF